MTMSKALTSMLLVVCLALMLNATGTTTAQQDQNANANANRSTQNSSNTGNTSASRATADNKFMMTAAMDSMMEVELGRIAAQKGTSDAVKQFGQRMVDDHTAANQELMQLASSKGVTLPTQLDAKHTASMNKLNALTGDKFDREYMKQMVKDHRKAVDLFQREANRGADADVKAWAAKTLPTLQEHLRMAESTSASLSGGTGNRGGNTNANNSNRR